MVLVIVEREFDDPVDVRALFKKESEGAWCLEAHGVRYLETFLSRDRRKMVCLYDAPDAEAVRTAERRIDMPVTRVWTADRRTTPPDE
ncbi:MAG TPA: DUF4242 domain-containing protein [Alphaproteobacteria bacterium]|nr:DUF4242 domain-containing protein [Alphaproteobacteria bacterium]